MAETEEVLCGLCIYLRKYNNEQGWNPISKAGWCWLHKHLRYARVRRRCDDYKPIDAIELLKGLNQ